MQEKKEKQGDKVYIIGKEYELKFSRLVEAYGSRRCAEGEYELISEEEIIYLRLKLPEGSLCCRNIKEANEKELQEGFYKNKEDQEKFFKLEGRELIKDKLTSIEGDKMIKNSGYKTYFDHAIIETESIEKICS